jgi:YD repeat-containing protein
LSRIVYCDEAKNRKLDHGLQTHFFYNAITIGNASEALTGTAYWRSLPRLAYTSPQQMALLQLQYRRNQLYVYPEHEDHDPKNGDVFASNTPYVLISQGSSGSDQKLLEAVAWTLASFQPKTKRKLAEGGALMAAVQMVFRRSNQRVETFEDYLTGKAHPTVFDGNTIDELRMINLAHEIKPEKVPPVVQLRVVDEDEPRLGIDYFEDQPKVKLFDTPGAVSRLLKSTMKNYRMVVSAEQSFDLNERPMTYHWRVLRGDPNEITITPLNADNSRVEIIIPHQEARPVEPDSEITSSRVDIGAFVHNGTYYSAPAFVSLYSPRNEVRSYNQQGNIESVEYLPFETQYEDPVLTTPRDWSDQYDYDQNQNLIGWTRTRDSSVEQFTADGAIVLQTDELGRAIEARSVGYRRSIDPKKIPPRLEQHLGPELRYYAYESPEDRIGHIVKREPAGGDQ